MLVTGGNTNVSTYFQMRLTAGGDATGLTITDFDLTYTRSGDTPAAKADATDLGSANAAHTDNGGYEVDATDAPGLHRFDFPDAAFAAGVREVLLSVKHASCFTETLRVEIDGEVSVTEWNGVKLGTTNPLPNAASDAAGGLPISDAGGLDMDTTDANVTTVLTGTPTTKYMGPRGPGVYVDSGAANVNTVTGTDGTIDNPVSTFAAARTIADAIGVTRYYLEGNSDLALAATHVDWEFIGVGSVADNIINLGSQDVSRSLFVDLTIEGTQGGAGRIEAIECALQDPGAGATTLHIFALRCGLVDDIEVDTSNNNVFDSCYSLVAGATTPKIIATGAAGTIEIRHYSGGIELSTLSASHNVSIEGMGQVIFTADCNVNANVSIRGLFTITDNTAGMASLTQDAVVNMPKINTEADTALSDYDGPTNAEMEARTVSAAAATNLETHYDGVEGFASAYAGTRGPGVYFDDTAANTNTVNGVDGTWSNPVSTIGAVKTIADSLGVKRAYLINNTDAVLAAAMPDWEIIGIGEMMANTIDLGTRDVDNSAFYNVLISGVQGGTGRFQADGCVLSGITSMEITALACVLADGSPLVLRDDCAFDSCFSAVAGGGSPTLDINSVANVNVYCRHYSGGLQIDNAVATTVMSYEADGQIIIDATCTSLTIHVRGNCTITDNGTTTSLTQDAAVTRTSINAECDTAINPVKTVTDNLPDSGALNDLASILTDTTKMVAGIVNGTVDTVVNTHTPTTTEFQADDITTAAADHFIGRIVTFLTGTLADQSTDITDYVVVGGIGQFTVTALTSAPANNDTFKIT